MPTMTLADPWDGYAFNKPKMDERVRWLELIEIFGSLFGIGVVMFLILVGFFIWRCRARN
jgi:hypothetical protein